MWQCKSLGWFLNLLVSLVLVAGLPAPNASSAEVPPEGDGKLRIIAFGAHPDDCEVHAGGTALGLSAQTAGLLHCRIPKSRG